MVAWDGTRIDPPIIDWKAGRPWNELILYPFGKDWIFVRYIKNLHPCLVDEFKPIFGLPKNGTHWFLLGKKMLMIQRYPSIRGKPLSPTTEGDRQLAYVFREICGVKPSYQTSVQIIDDEPRSFNDTTLIPEDDWDILGSTLYEKIFIGRDAFRHHLEQIVGPDQIIGLNQISNRLESVISRVDPSALRLVFHILNRIRSRL